MSLGIVSSNLLSAYYGLSSLVSNPSNTFAKIDADGDGSLTQTELGDFVTLTKSEGGKLADASTLLRTMDEDGDGAVSEDEYTTYAQARGAQLDLVLAAQETIADLELSLIESIGNNSNSTGTASSAANTAATIINKYASAVTSVADLVLNSLDVEA